MSYADFLQTMTPYNHGKLQDKDFIEDFVKEHTPRILSRVDVNKDGVLSHQEFWKWEKIGSSDDLTDALNKFDVSSSFQSGLKLIRLIILEN